jgi:hypothetical protein
MLKQTRAETDTLFPGVQFGSLRLIGLTSRSFRSINTYFQIFKLQTDQALFI